MTGAIRLEPGNVMCVFGLRGSGKSTLVNHICEAYGKRALVYDTLSEVPPDAAYDSYTPRDRRSIAELEAVIRRLAHSPYRVFVIDEANRFAPSKPAPLPYLVSEINDIGRHQPYRIAVVYVARRPVTLNQDITELADYLVCFKLTGRNDTAYLNGIAEGFGTTVRGLKPYQFVIAYRDRSIRKFEPVKPSAAWLKRAKST